MFRNVLGRFGVEAVSFGEGGLLVMKVGVTGFETIEAMVGLGHDDEMVSFGVEVSMEHIYQLLFKF